MPLLLPDAGLDQGVEGCLLPERLDDLLHVRGVREGDGGDHDSKGGLVRGVGQVVAVQLVGQCLWEQRTVKMRKKLSRERQKRSNKKEF